MSIRLPSTRALPLLLAAALLAVGCTPRGGGGRGGGGGDDDDAAGGSEDPEDATLPCPGGEGEYDAWTVDLEPGEFEITVDTIAAATAFDPGLDLFEGPATNADLFDSADDTVDCTFPPPQYQCPQVTGFLETSGSFEVRVYNYGECAGSVGAYRIFGSSGGVDLVFESNENDATGDGGGDDVPM